MAERIIERRDYIILKLTEAGATRGDAEVIAAHTDRIVNAMFDTMSQELRLVQDASLLSVATCTLKIMSMEADDKMNGIMNDPKFN